MNRKLSKPLLITAFSFSILAGCQDQQQASGGNSAYQSIRSTDQVSPSVKLTKAGKNLKLYGATRFRLKTEVNDTALDTAARNSVCSLTSTAFNATTKIGETVLLPSFGKSTPPMEIECSGSGLTLRKTVNAVNLTEQAYTEAAVLHVTVGFGLIGAGVTAGQASARDKSKDVYGYPKSVELSSRDQ